MSHLDVELGQTVFNAVDSLRGQAGRCSLARSKDISEQAWGHIRHIMDCGGRICHTGDDILQHDRIVENVLGGKGEWSRNGAHALAWDLVQHTDHGHYELFTLENLCKQGVAVYTYSPETMRIMRLIIVWRGKINGMG